MWAARSVAHEFVSYDPPWGEVWWIQVSVRFILSRHVVS